MKENKFYLSDKLFYFPIIFFGVYLLIRLVNTSNLISMFPLDYTNDISAYIAQLHFLKVCGFHNFCPYWYGGIIAFLFTPPAWYFFTLTIYLITNNILLSTYISIILMYVLGFFGFCLFSKFLKISKIKAISLFFLFFANPIAIGEFLRLGRLTSFFAWVIFIFLFLIILIYKDRNLDKKFLFFILFYTILILSHFQEFILFNFLLLGFFLIKSNKEKIYIILSAIVSCLLASFWLAPFLMNVSKSSLWNYSLSNWLLAFNGGLLLTNIISILIVILFLFLFYIHWINNEKSKKELIFYLPSLVLALLLITRLIIFVSILRNIAPDPHIFYFILLSIYLFANTKFSSKLIKIIIFVFIAMIFVSLVVSLIHTPWFTKYTSIEYDALELFKEVNGKFFIFGTYPTSYSRAYDSYAPIFNNLSSAVGWYPHATTKDYMEKVFSLYNSYDNGDCINIEKKLKDLNVNYVIVFEENCGKLLNCNLLLKEKKEKVCLYSV